MDTPRTTVFRKLFATMDADGDGQIDATEGTAIGRILGGGDADAGARFWRELQSEADTDGSGTVGLDEYISYGRSKTRLEDVEKLQMDLVRLEESRGRRAQQSQRTELDRRTKAERVFAYLDADKSGTLRLGELCKLAKNQEAL